MINGDRVLSADEDGNLRAALGAMGFGYLDENGQVRALLGEVRPVQAHRPRIPLPGRRGTL